MRLGRPLKNHTCEQGEANSVAEALAADFAERDFDAALVADNAAVLHPLVLPAQTLPIGDGTKNLGAEQAVPFRFEGAVVDGLRLGHFAMRPGANFFRTRQADADRIEIGDQAGAIIRAAAIQGDFLPPRLSPGPRAHAAGPAEAQLRDTSDHSVVAKQVRSLLRTCRLKLPSPRLFPPVASAASSTRRPNRAIAIRARAR